MGAGAGAYGRQELSFQTRGQRQRQRHGQGALPFQGLSSAAEAGPYAYARPARRRVQTRVVLTLQNTARNAPQCPAAVSAAPPSLGVSWGDSIIAAPALQVSADVPDNLLMAGNFPEWFETDQDYMFQYGFAHAVTESALAPSPAPIHGLHGSPTPTLVITAADAGVEQHPGAMRPYAPSGYSTSDNLTGYVLALSVRVALSKIDVPTTVFACSS